jgi:hypothetical protein
MNLNSLAFSEKTDVADAVADYLSWQELIHTSYFHHRQFVKLTAYSIATCHGFGPSVEFASDPDFGSVVRWHSHIKGSTE